MAFPGFVGFYRDSPCGAILFNLFLPAGRNRVASTPHTSSRHHALDETPISDYKDTSDQRVRDSLGILGWILECSAVYHPLGVEHGDIGIGSDLQPAFGLNAEPLSGHQAHFAKRVHQRKCVLLANIAA